MAPSILRHRAAPALAAGALLLAAACGEAPPSTPSPPSPARPAGADWPSYRGGPALQGVAEGSLGDALELAWTYQTGGAITSSPIVHGGIAYVGSDDGSLHAVDLASGEKRWSYATDDMIEAPPLWHDGRVYVGSSDFFFYAVDAASGALVWKAEMGDKVLGGANHARLADGVTRIVAGSYDSKLYCFDAASGKVLWTYETDNYVNGTPAVLGDRIVFGGCDAVLHVVSVATGQSIARVELGQDCHVAGSVALAGGHAFFGHYGNEFVCVDLEAAEVLWAHSGREAFFSSPAIGSDRVVFGGRDRKLHCVQRSDGAALWDFPTRRKVDGSPVICGDKVVFGSGDGRLYLVRLADGQEVWHYDIGQPLFSSPAVAAGMVLIGCQDGRLYAFRAPPA